VVGPTFATVQRQLRVRRILHASACGARAEPGGRVDAATPATYIGGVGCATKRAVGQLVLLMFFGSLGLPLLSGAHQLVGPDGDCAGPLLRDRDRAHVDAAGSTQGETSDHCVLCHWLRAVGSATLTLPAASAPLFVVSRTALSGLTTTPHGRSIRSLPSRAPPVVL
jgi:hypothetical protein